MLPDWNSSPRISTAFTYRGLDAVLLENRSLRVVLLPEKGGDIVSLRDKRTDVDVLWHAPHNWSAPTARYLPSEPNSTWNDHYPGGWQTNLPNAGGEREIAGSAYGLHGESALLPWDATVTRADDEAVSVRLEVELVRYPFSVERELTLHADESKLRCSETVTNHGGVELDYVWQQHIALGPPLLAPDARLDVPAARGVVEDYGDGYPNRRLRSGAEFDWPNAPGHDGGEIDLSTDVPGQDAEIHDLAYAIDLSEGWYALTNPELNLGFALRFPTDPFESLWYWQPFGGYAESPFWNRTYNVGLEPTTAYPGDTEGQRTSGTMKTLAPGETVEAEFVAATYGGLSAVDSVSADGVVDGPPR
ncbi:aldose 1-epimerase [Haloprofundus halophilus]|uniref:aldose 1-epimerase n=1 Tax=Haloprofundus halophilus TaxID=2283527 RepID=UPI000E42ED58|nr:aldose 1-epimerase [Haloprofundus halophilus]